MDAQTACDALHRGLCLELQYDGFGRTVEVHAVGLTHDGHEMLSVWQVRGGSESNERQGWKNMRLDEILFSRVTDEKSEAPRQEYKRGNKAFATIICQI